MTVFASAAARLQARSSERQILHTNVLQTTTHHDATRNTPRSGISLNRTDGRENLPKRHFKAEQSRAAEGTIWLHSDAPHQTLLSTTTKPHPAPKRMDRSNTPLCPQLKIVSQLLHKITKTLQNSIEMDYGRTVFPQNQDRSGYRKFQ
jgi:hypothetical protein